MHWWQLICIIQIDRISDFGINRVWKRLLFFCFCRRLHLNHDFNHCVDGQILNMNKIGKPFKSTMCSLQQKGGWIIGTKQKKICDAWRHGQGMIQRMNGPLQIESLNQRKNEWNPIFNLFGSFEYREKPGMEWGKDDTFIVCIFFSVLCSICILLRVVFILSFFKILTLLKSAYHSVSLLMLIDYFAATVNAVFIITSWLRFMLIDAVVYLWPIVDWKTHTK